MIGIARASARDRSDLVRAVAAEMRMQPAIVEKDFWVCYTLDHLFHRSEFGESIVFKGGTSLSKAYHLIDRFSEDIDLILDWRLLGYGKDEPWEERSNTKQDRFKLDTIERTNRYLAETFVPSIRESISEELGADVDVHPADEEETVIFAYPRAFASTAALDHIRLEIGPLAAWAPTEKATVTPYLAESRPRIFERPSAEVVTARPERTFWEKATILHQEANRPGSKPMPRRYSRHYYDLYRLGHSRVKAAALANPELLARVVAFKEKFYRTPWSRLDQAKPGTLRLAPPDSRMRELAADYAAMQEMLVGERPTLAEIVGYMAALEDEVNSA
jgi:hypothetical protein